MNSDSKPHLAEVHTLYATNARDIPEMMHILAEEIAENDGAEDEETTKAVVLIRVGADGGMQMYGWGDTDVIHSAGVLALGLQNLGMMHIDTGMFDE